MIIKLKPATLKLLLDRYPKAFLDDGVFDLDRLILTYPDSDITKAILDSIFKEHEQAFLYGK